MAQELGDFVDVAGGPAFAYPLLTPLESLATVDEASVRDMVGLCFSSSWDASGVSKADKPAMVVVSVGGAIDLQSGAADASGPHRRAFRGGSASLGHA